MNRLPQRLIRYVLIFMAVFFIVTPVFTVNINASLSDFQNTCSTQSTSEECKPLQIKDVQELVAKAISLLWSLGAVVFFLLLLFNGAVFLIGSWEDAEYILGVSIKDAKKRMTQWVVGFIMFFLSYPIMNTLLQLLVTNDTDCYASLKEPGFTFFFPDVCNKSDTDTTN